MDITQKLVGAAASGFLMVQVAAAQNQGTIGSGIQSLWDIGFFKYGAPFLLMFALVFGLTTKLSIFENDQVSAIVAVTAGLFVDAAILQGYVSGPTLEVFLFQFFGAFAVIASGLLVVVMAAGLGGYEGEWAFGDNAKRAFFVLGGLAAVTAFIGWGGLQWLEISAAQSEVGNLGFFSNDLFILLVVVVLIVGLVWWVTGGEEGGGGEEGE